MKQKTCSLIKINNWDLERKFIWCFCELSACLNEEILVHAKLFTYILSLHIAYQTNVKAQKLFVFTQTHETGKTLLKLLSGLKLILVKWRREFIKKSSIIDRDTMTLMILRQWRINVKLFSSLSFEINSKAWLRVQLKNFPD